MKNFLLSVLILCCFVQYHASEHNNKYAGLSYQILSVDALQRNTNEDIVKLSVRGFLADACEAGKPALSIAHACLHESNVLREPIIARLQKLQDAGITAASSARSPEVDVQIMKEAQSRYGNDTAFAGFKQGLFNRK